MRIWSFGKEFPCDWVLILRTVCSPAKLLYGTSDIMNTVLYNYKYKVQVCTYNNNGCLWSYEVGEVHRWKIGTAFKGTSLDLQSRKNLDLFA